VDCKTLGVRKLGFFTDTFATKRFFVRILRGFFVYAGGFSVPLWKMLRERWTQIIVSTIRSLLRLYGLLHKFLYYLV